jgi:hypothetical protein
MAAGIDHKMTMAFALTWQQTKTNTETFETYNRLKRKSTHQQGRLTKLQKLQKIELIAKLELKDSTRS